MNVKRMVSISLATLISTNMYFTMYANTLKSNATLESSIEEKDNQIEDIVFKNNEILKSEYGIDLKKLSLIYGENIELTEEQEEIFESLELMTYDLLEMFIEFGCVDENKNLIGLNHLERDDLDEIKSYVNEIKVMRDRLMNSVQQHEQRLKRKYLLEVSEQYDLIQDGQFDFDAYLDLPLTTKVEYEEQLKNY